MGPEFIISSIYGYKRIRNRSVKIWKTRHEISSVSHTRCVCVCVCVCVIDFIILQIRHAGKPPSCHAVVAIHTVRPPRNCNTMHGGEFTLLISSYLPN